MTVLSPRGVPTPLAATRLLPPDSLHGRPARRGPLPGTGSRSAPSRPKYGQTVDRESAYEMITARIAAARQAAVDAAVRAGVDPTTAAGMNSMTAAQQQREVARQQKELETAQARAQRQAEQQARAQQKAAAAAERERQRTINSAIRTGGKVVGSRLGQDVIRGVFGTLFGGGKSR